MLLPIMLTAIYRHRQMLMNLAPSDAEVYVSGESERLISLPAGNQRVATAAAAVRLRWCLLCRDVSFFPRPSPASLASSCHNLPDQRRQEAEQTYHSQNVPFPKWCLGSAASFCCGFRFSPEGVFVDGGLLLSPDLSIQSHGVTLFRYSSLPPPL